MARVGLVLGAGGIVGQAYHAGVLAALELDLGWDPRTADLIVGSSAGSVTGTALRLGVPAKDLACWSVEGPISDEGAPILEAFGSEPPTFPPFEPSSMLRGWRLPSTTLLARIARRPWAFRPAVAAMTLMPAGQVDITEHGNVLDEMVGAEWPEGLWLCTVRRDDGKRVAFGRPGSPPATLAQAVVASCAIPGYFKPVQIGNREYIDGGAHSPTNADILRNEHLDIVVVSSPMSAAHGRSGAPDAPMRWRAHNQLQRELQRLQANGTEVVRFEPGPRSLAAMGVNAMADDRSDRVTREAFFDAGEYATTARVGARLAALATRPSRQNLSPAGE
jgi:NTE family protein